MSKLVLAAGLLSLTILTGTARAEPPETRLEVTSVQGKAMTLTFAADPITTASTDAVFCATPAATPTLAKLWMPSMGHGSSPTRLVPAADGCTRVERINFLMDGDWEVRMTLADGDTGTFALLVVEE